MCIPAQTDLQRRAHVVVKAMRTSSALQPCINIPYFFSTSAFIPGVGNKGAHLHMPYPERAP